MNRLEGRFAVRQIPGGREYQEDDFGLIERGEADTDDGKVLLLADGMGGHVSGDTASSLVVKTFVEAHPRTDGPVTDRLRVCLTAANDALAEAVDERPELNGGRSTTVADVILEDGLDFGGFGMTYRVFEHNLEKIATVKEYVPADIAARTAENTVAPQASRFCDDLEWGLERFPSKRARPPGSTTGKSSTSIVSLSRGERRIS